MIQRQADILYDLSTLITEKPGGERMLYDRDRTDRLEKETFEHPPMQFRGAPFWAWNTTLERESLIWQIDCLKEMGFGGFFMHTRSGMATEYLGAEVMELIRACVEYGKEVGMLSCLYDEDRWSSGAAGGYVTEKKEYRQKTVCFSRENPAEMEARFAKEERCPELLAVYDICFDREDRLESYRVMEPEERAEGEKWYLYTLLKPLTGWHNGYTYLDTMNGEAVDEFIRVTYEAYRREVGGEFGKNVPVIFTDEPNYGQIQMKKFARDGRMAEFPWTQTFRETFRRRFGYDIVEGMPELVWNKKDDEFSTVRYHFYAHASELFAAAYSDRIGKWCSENGIAFTGHMLMEDSLFSQMSATGEAMRQYREFTIPGIDMLCDERQFATAKQAQSAAHQYGREGVMSELYGVTGWDFDFRGHKFQGDWQAALGVTLRVPHLAWVGMGGSAKRDYPASIGCQSAWFREYCFIEDHFARINTAMTRGVPEVRVAVLHPIESSWMTEGVREHTAAAGNAMNERFQDLVQWLLRGQIDFDLVSESLLPELYDEGKEGFCLGQMCYQAVLVPPLLTVRSTTLKALEGFQRRGGRVIVTGKIPPCVDGRPCAKARGVYDRAEKIPFLKTDILDALEEERQIAVYGQGGERRNDLIYQMRREGEERWLFIAHCDPPDRIDGRDSCRDQIRIEVKGLWRPELYDTITGNVEVVSYSTGNGNTVFTVPCHALDSLLFLLTPQAYKVSGSEQEKKDVARAALSASESALAVPDFVEYERSEQNVLVLDQCQWSRDGLNYNPCEEILRIDKAIRQELNYPLADGTDVQPWCIPAKAPSQFVWLRFAFDSERKAQCLLGYEYLEEVWLNGGKVEQEEAGYFVDRAIHTLILPCLKVGSNVLTVRVPISERISLENLFLIGDFGVKAVGRVAAITKAPEKIAFGSVTGQGMPFYGAAVTYRIPFACEAGNLKVRADYYNGALISARLDGREAGKIVLPPYELMIPDVGAGEHLLELTLFASRINTFGALHLCVPVSWKGPNMWYTEGCGWADEYQLTDVGIMKKPVLTICPAAERENGSKR